MASNQTEHAGMDAGMDATRTVNMCYSIWFFFPPEKSMMYKFWFILDSSHRELEGRSKFSERHSTY